MTYGLSSNDCTALWVIILYTNMINYTYLFSLWIEIYKITKTPIDNTYNKRANIYHIVNHTIAILWATMSLLFHTSSSETKWELSNDGDLYGFIVACIAGILAFLSLVLIIMTIKKIKTG